MLSHVTLQVLILQSSSNSDLWCVIVKIYIFIPKATRSRYSRGVLLNDTTYLFYEYSSRCDKVALTYRRLTRGVSWRRKWDWEPSGMGVYLPRTFIRGQHFDNLPFNTSMFLCYAYWANFEHNIGPGVLQPYRLGLLALGSEFYEIMDLTVCRTPWMGDRPIAKPLPTRGNTNIVSRFMV
jgi:hypothetical protein